MSKSPRKLSSPRKVTINNNTDAAPSSSSLVQGKLPKNISDKVTEAAGSEGLATFQERGRRPFPKEQKDFLGSHLKDLQAVKKDKGHKHAAVVAFKARVADDFVRRFTFPTARVKEEKVVSQLSAFYVEPP